jgi:transposase-like protein
MLHQRGFSGIMPTVIVANLHCDRLRFLLRAKAAHILTFYAYPKEHWKTIRTNNVIERRFGEVKRRSHKMVAAFRTEGSCVLLFYAVIRSLHFNKLTMPALSTKQPDAELYTELDIPPSECGGEAML